MGFLLRQLEDTAESGRPKNMNIKKNIKVNIKMYGQWTPPSLVLKLDLRV